jgi:iron complex outermembrane receptor protein
MSKQYHPLLLAGLLCASIAHSLAADITEQDYFSDLPEVLTVTRLAQPLSDTPGAVTIIDRDKIRRSGARELADVLRLVPGYLVGGINGAHPGVAYHAPLDEYGARNLVLIDGRSAYNSFYLGDTSRGLQGVLLEDIERIEVLRGSNSAAYGANAMFGVINIITRHSADTRGAELSYTNGEVGIRDSMARVGWGNDVASFRLSTGRRYDTGFSGANDDKVTEQWHFRGDLRPAADQDVMLTAGSIDLAQGRGQGSVGDPFRTTSWRENFANLQWRKQLSDTDEIKLSASYDESTSRDASPYSLDPSVTLDFGGHSSKTSLELQHQFGLTPQLRAVWGAGYERNEARSPGLFYDNGTIAIQEEHLFGNLEWRPHEQWLINAGGFWTRNSEVGNHFTPRLMANFQMVQDHTLRAGVAESLRTPNVFELNADVRYYPKNTSNRPLPRSLSGLSKQDTIALFAKLNLPARSVAASGLVTPEKLETQEIGYFGNFRSIRMTVDVRAYIEKTKDLITDGDRIIPGYISGILPPPYPPLPYNVPMVLGDFVNSPGFKIRGVEYQLRWKPLEDTEIWLNQTFQKLIWDNDAAANDVNMPPTHASTIALFQKLPGGLDFSVMFHTLGSMTWGNGDSGQLPNRRRIDARLAYPFLVGSTRVEAAMTVQAANGNYPDSLMKYGYEFERRAFGTLRIEF